MNIISNTCLGAALYKFGFKIPFSNPFCWSFIDFNSMFYLIKNYENINFRNFKLLVETEKNENSNR